MPEKCRSLPLAAWPEADRDGWQAACRPAQRLDPGGAAGAMRPVSQVSHQRAYGLLLACLARAGRLDPAAPPAGNVVPEIVDLFLEALEDRGLASVTRNNYLNRILRVATILAPDRDFAWLRERALLAARQAKPRPKAHRIHVRRVGLRLMDEAGGKVGTPLEKPAIIATG